VLRAAALQFVATPFNLAHNLETAERLTRQAAAVGAQVVVLPEFFSTGCVYSRKLADAAEEPGGPALQWLARLSAELGICIGGGVLLRERGRVYNVLALACPGGREYRGYRQRPWLWERALFEAGRTGPVIAETEFGRLGLLGGWDMAHRPAWQALRGRVDAVLIASAAPRLHRAVLNFPLGRKAYLAQLAPALLRARDAMDAWYEAGPAAGAAWLGAPVAHAALAGRFVTELPYPRLSLLALALARPRYWPLARQARLASLRATFYAGSAIFDASGKAAAKVEAEEGLAFAELEARRGAGAGAAPAKAPESPAELRVLDSVLGSLEAARRAVSTLGSGRSLQAG
jgi:predicted amidohydrolase